jgi:hypothetical protein
VSADGYYRFRLSAHILPDTEAVSSAFFDNPIKLQPAGAHINAHVNTVGFEIEFPDWSGGMPDRILRDGR